MRLRRTLGPLLAATLLVGLISGCGVKANEGARSPGPAGGLSDSSARSTTPSDGGIGGSTKAVPKGPSTRGPGTNGSGLGNSEMRNTLIQTYQKFGLDSTQATCLADGLIRSGALGSSGSSSATPDLSKIGNLLVQCNVTISDFGGSAPSGGSGGSAPSGTSPTLPGGG
jgi:hypothetical protein